MQKRWQLFLIIIIISLTIYNILPTLFYYSKPLKKSIEQKEAKKIALSIGRRVNTLEKDSTKWVESYCKLLKINQKSIILENNPEFLTVEFKSDTDAKKFEKYVTRAGALIPFVPAKLTPSYNESEKKVTLKRQIPLHFDQQNMLSLFEYTKKFEKSKPTQKYKEFIFDRAAILGSTLGGVNDFSVKVNKIIADPNSLENKQLIISLSQEIVEYAQVFGEKSSICRRFFSSFTQNNLKDKNETIKSLIKNISLTRDEIKLEKANLKEKSEEKEALLNTAENGLSKAEKIIKNNESAFTAGQTPLSYNDALNALEKNASLTLQNPIIKQISIDWNKDQIILNLHQDLPKQASQVIINELAKITNITGENISKENAVYTIKLSKLSKSQSILFLNLQEVAKLQTKSIFNILKNNWHPHHPELALENYPIYDWETYQNLPESEKKLCLVVFTPSSSMPDGLRNNSCYIMAKGLDRILQKYQNIETDSGKRFIEDFNALNMLLQQNGFVGYPGSYLSSVSEFNKDFIFEKNDYYSPLIAATREDFNVYGSKKYASLELSDIEQRVLTLNKIETKIHEDLIKMQEEYNFASTNYYSQYDSPPVYKNIFLNNLMLSCKKYFRGDDRKILRWGLDLSGGKTVQLELRDQNNKLVKNEADLKQGVNELYNRVNKMGVSDVNIRIVDSNIVLDFPGAQNLSARDLVQASTMCFNVINEKFSTYNKNLQDHVNKFLSDVWNEAVVTNQKDIQSINKIAHKHLYEEHKRSQSAKTLHQHGLRLASPDDESLPIFDTTLSKIAIFRNQDVHKSDNICPLIIVFNNFALEGSSLSNIRSSYDPSKGNFLNFEVKGSLPIENKKINAKDLLYEWTSHFSKEQLTPELNYTSKGWRMAVILNGFIISAPTLDASIRDAATISGSFTQREINQLTADLKAGSLSYTPHILSEKNVSPELGSKERLQGIIATIFALLLVISTMVCYYKFSGIIASIAVIFNLLIMWATLQNIGATLSLAGIAGIILTVGMAVDANVLVFERIKEEFAITNKIAYSIATGYKKAFSAILDSNVTTIIAALILLNFDAGPIKGFAVTLIIGIASSMFCALFLTRFFFTKWAANPSNTKLNMLNLIKSSNFNFLNKAKYVYGLSILIILVGSLVLFSQKKSVLGMDFTGGVSLDVEFSKNDKNYSELVKQAFLAKGANIKDFEIRELGSKNSLRILLGTSMEQKNKPFYNMPIDLNKKNISFAYENNPRIVWIVDALKAKNLFLSKESLNKLDTSWTAMSGQMSENMRNNAIMGLSLALFAILIYLTFRFEFKFAISAMLCLIHDVLISIAAISILNALKVPVIIDLHTIAALMTIIGYSLNDTIIIFDRIRESLKLMKKYSYKDIINHSLNITLSRTTLTSLTTLLVLLALVFLGGPAIFSFSLVMTLGVIFGTLSSLFIASPLMLFFHKLEEKKALKEIKSK